MTRCLKAMGSCTVHKSHRAEKRCGLFAEDSASQACMSHQANASVRARIGRHVRNRAETRSTRTSTIVSIACKFMAGKKGEYRCYANIIRMRTLKYIVVTIRRILQTRVKRGLTRLIKSFRLSCCTIFFRAGWKIHVLICISTCDNLLAETSLTDFRQVHKRRQALIPVYVCKMHTTSSRAWSSKHGPMTRQTICIHMQNFWN